MEPHAATPEREVLETALSIAESTSTRFQPLMPTNLKCHLVPFFGSFAGARVITIGLNPSSGEFASRRTWPLTLTPADHASRLANYWTSVNPGPHPWFQPWSTVLSELGVAYRSGEAAHIDLSPRATKAAGRFKTEPLKSLFLEMLQADAPIWVEALRRATRCSLLLATGSATNAYYINEFIRDKVSLPGIGLEGDWRRGGAGQTALHTLCLPGGREIPLFFCSTGPTRTRGAVLISACRAHMDTLRRLLGYT